MAETGATAVSVPEAVRGVDLVVVTIPEKNIPNLPVGLFADTRARVVVVDTGNYYPRHRDGRIEAIEAGLPESKWVAQQLGRPVIKAFNNIYAKHLLELGRPKGTPRRIALPVAGDDDAAKAISHISHIGVTRSPLPVVLGGLAGRSRREDVVGTTRAGV